MAKANPKLAKDPQRKNAGHDGEEAGLRQAGIFWAGIGLGKI